MSQPPFPSFSAPAPESPTPEAQASTPATSSSEEVERRLLEARKRKAEREKAIEDRKRKFELELLELEEKFEAELGPRGSAFEIVDATDQGEGFIVLKLGYGVAYHAFKNSKMKEKDVHAFVLPCVVHPERAKFLELVERRHELPIRCANALVTLHGAKAEDAAGKF